MKKVTKNTQETAKTETTENRQKASNLNLFVGVDLELAATICAASYTHHLNGWSQSEFAGKLDAQAAAAFRKCDIDKWDIVEEKSSPAATATALVAHKRTICGVVVETLEEEETDENKAHCEREQAADALTGSIEFSDLVQTAAAELVAVLRADYPRRKRVRFGELTEQERRRVRSAIAKYVDSQKSYDKHAESIENSIEMAAATGEIDLADTQAAVTAAAAELGGHFPQLLKYMTVERLESAEIAALWGCSVQWVNHEERRLMGKVAEFLSA